MSGVKLSKEKISLFVAMPISTSASYQKDYSVGQTHFDDVLEEIISPAVEMSRFDLLIQPRITGTKIIQREIISIVLKSHMIIYDLTCANPNVLFELGLRMALNRPFCLIAEKDFEIPFDVNSINTFRYERGWAENRNLPGIKSLSGFIEDSWKSTLGRTGIWKDTGLDAVWGAIHHKPEPYDIREMSDRAMLDLMHANIEDVRRDVEYLSARVLPSYYDRSNVRVNDADLISELNEGKYKVFAARILDLDYFPGDKAELEVVTKYLKNEKMSLAEARLLYGFLDACFLVRGDDPDQWPI